MPVGAAGPQIPLRTTLGKTLGMLRTTRQLIDDAVRAGTAILAFNAITLEHVEAIALGAARSGRPAIVQISENAVRYHGALVPFALACVAECDRSAAALSVHLDHFESLDLIGDSVPDGISSMMVDASRLPHDENVAATARMARWAAERGLFLEAELGEVGGKDGAHAPGVRTDPGEAAQFVADTGVDALAVAVGSSHAMTTRTAKMDLDLIGALQDAVAVPLVLHGSSGVEDDELRRAVARGIVKVNIGTLLNRHFTAAVRDALADDPALVDPRKYLGPARDATADAVAVALTGLSR